MGTMNDLSEASPGSAAGDPPVRQQMPPLPAGIACPMQVETARFHGFSHCGHPLVSGGAGFSGQIVEARTTVALAHQSIGAEVLLVWEPGSTSTPIIVGIIQPVSAQSTGAAAAPELLSIRADAREYVISAEREIVLRCGDASITLTRAGKVIIKGNYVVSSSAGCNKIKGAAVDIN